MAPLIYDGVKVNLLDTPGYGDFTGELRAGLRAADAALFVVSAVDGVDAATTALWAECDQLETPRAVVISRLDHPRANYDAALAACQRAFGESVVPAYLPAPHGRTVTGLLGLLSGHGFGLRRRVAGARGPGRRLPDELAGRRSRSAAR